jgi:EAL and modified HD-GYP domain-containing signal transduction protein
VLEILESVRAEMEVLAGIRFFRERGFRIALDDYASARHDERLLELADIVKIDLLAEPEERWSQTVSMLLDRGLVVVAEKVETIEQFERCRALGIQTFQGYWFQRPETFVARSTPTYRLASLQVLSALQNPELSLGMIERIVHQDLSLVYRLLRVINSGYYNLRRAVTSLQEALLLLGIDNVRRLCALTALAAFEDRPQELMVNALVRARMCELLAALRLPQRAAEHFLAGLLSHLDALLGVPTSEAIQRLPLAKDLVSALATYQGPMGATLRYVIAFEHGDWGASDAISVDPLYGQRVYIEAVRWAEEARTLLAA